MKRTNRITWMLAALAMLALAGPTWGGWNDGLATDANCVAVWQFENGALTTDTGPVGTNTLTAVNTPVADTVNYRQGAASCDFESTEKDYFKIADASLSTGFPGKSGGHAEDFSITFWLKWESLAGVGSTKYVISKGVSPCSFIVFMTCPGPPDNETRISCKTYYSSTEYVITHTLDMATGKWYHVGISCDHGVANTSFIRVYDADAGTATTATGTLRTSVGTDLLAIGNRSDLLTNGIFLFDGLMDEMAVFNDALSSDECDQVRSGTYGQGVGSLRRAWWWRRRHGG